jgi:L-asparaginase II
VTSQPDPVVVEVTRDGFVEAVHRGRAVGLDAAGGVALAVGAVDEPVLLRSAAKPLQALAMVRAGLDLDPEGLAIACGSHDGTDAHVHVVDRVLAHAALARVALQSTPMLPLEPRAAARCLLDGGPDAVHHNCSGKHAAMLLTCVTNGWPTATYLEREHPLQQAILATIEDVAGEPVAHVATDGCGAPIAAISLTGLARGFARLGAAEEGTAEHRVAQAMRAHPEMVGGERRDVTRLTRAVPGLVAKDGAEGCFAAALPDGRAVGVKVDDGALRAATPLLVAALVALGADADALGPLSEHPVLGHGEPVGAVRATAF